MSLELTFDLIYIFNPMADQIVVSTRRFRKI
jgi:hypothetical protein